MLMKMVRWFILLKVRIIWMNDIAKFRLCKLNDKELIERIDKIVDEIYQNGEIPTRHIPARPDHDFDLLIGELILRYDEKRTKV